MLSYYLYWMYCNCVVYSWHWAMIRSWTSGVILLQSDWFDFLFLCIQMYYLYDVYCNVKSWYWWQYNSGNRGLSKKRRLVTIVSLFWLHLSSKSIQYLYDTYCNVESWYWWSDNGGNWGLSALLGLQSSVLATNSNIQQQALLTKKNKQTNKQTDK